MIPAEIIALGLDNPKTGLGDLSVDDTPEMIKLVAEIDKMNSVSVTTPTNWGLVEQCSRIILRDYVKHFQVAAYYGISLIKSNFGFQGIANTAAIFDGIFDKHWDDSLPPKKRKKGRFNAVEYWLEFATDFVENYSGEPIAQSIIDDCTTYVKNLDNTMANIDQDTAPNLRPLLNIISHISTFDDVTPPEVEHEANANANEESTSSSSGESSEGSSAIEASSDKKDATSNETVSKTDSSSSSSSEATSKAQTAAPKAPAKPIDVPVAEGAEEKCKIAFSFLLDAANDLFSNDIYSAESYLYRRLGSWLKIKKLPPNENGLTRILSPDEDVKNIIEKLYIGNQFEKLLNACEQYVSSYLYWLDLSYYSAKAAEKLNHKEISDAITSAVKLFISRFPGIPDLKFDDGVPMSSADTKAWLSSLEEKRDIGKIGNDTINAKIVDAIDLSRTEFENAIAILEKFIKSSAGIDQLRFEAGLSVVFSLNNRNDLATGLIGRVLSKLHENELSSWDQDRSAEILSYAFDVYKSAERLSDAAIVLSELAELSPSKAVTKKYTND